MKIGIDQEASGYRANETERVPNIHKGDIYIYILYIYIHIYIYIIYIHIKCICMICIIYIYICMFMYQHIIILSHIRLLFDMNGWLEHFNHIQQQHGAQLDPQLGISSDQDSTVVQIRWPIHAGWKDCPGCWMLDAR